MSETSGFEGGAGGLIVDLREVADAPSFEALPAGNYAAEIDEMEYAVSSAGNPMWKVKYVITAEGDFAGRYLFDQMTFSEKALPYTKKTIAMIKPELLDAPFDVEQAAAQQVLQGIAVILKVGIEEYQGEPRNKVKGVKPLQADGFM